MSYFYRNHGSIHYIETEKKKGKLANQEKKDDIDRANSREARMYQGLEIDYDMNITRCRNEYL